MKKTSIILLIFLSVTVLFGCNKEKAFDLNEFGFENNNGMCKWIEITDYDFEKGYAEFSKNNSVQYFLDFKENAVISSCSIDSQHKPSTQTLQLFKKIDNDTAIIGEKPILITKRIVHNDMLVIVILRNKSESFFILEEMVDIVQNEDENSKYYFK